MIEINKIYNKDCDEGMKLLQDESIDMQITSPPYWALRDYGNPVERVWNVVEGCEHQWGDIIPYAKKDERTPEQKKSQGATVGNSINSENFAKGNSGSFCLKCNAWKGQLGLEPSYQLYLKHLIDIFREVKRVLKKDGTCWVNLGDTYWVGGNNRGSSEENLSEKQKSNRGARGQVQIEWDKTYKRKCLVGIPLRFALMMIDDGWILRNTIIWHKPNAMPSSAKDRFNVDFEYLFFFAKNEDYYFETQYEKSIWVDKDKRSKIKGGVKSKGKSESGKYAISGTAYSENGQRNKRTVWSICTKGTSEAHFATYPSELIETPIKAGCKKDGVCMDIFMGSGTTALTSLELGRKFIGFEINPEYVKIAEGRIKKATTQTKLNTDGGEFFSSQP